MGDLIQGHIPVAGLAPRPVPYHWAVQPEEEPAPRGVSVQVPSWAVQAGLPSMLRSATLGRLQYKRAS